MKRIYAFLSYPESSNACEIADSMRKVGWDFARSPLHDRDKHKDGTQKKPHYHWLVGFEKDPPRAKDFIECVKAIRGVVCYEELHVKNPWSAVEYFTHKNHPDKAQYDEEEVVNSEGWELEKYTTQEQRNEHRKYLKTLQKQDDASALVDILSMVGSEPGKCNGFQPLVDKVIKNNPLLLPLVLKNTYFLNTYILSKLTEERLKTSESAEIDRLSAEVGRLALENEELQKELKFVRKSCSYYYEKATGEKAPEDYEWTF